MKPDTPARAARKAAGYRSGAMVAKRLRISTETVLEAERLGGRPTFERAEQLAKLYGCSANLFLNITPGNQAGEERSERSK